MMLFKKKKKENLQKQVREIKSPSDIYINNVSYYVEYLGEKLGVENPNENTEFFEKWGLQYYNAAMYFVNYVDSTVNYEELEAGLDVSLDIKDMISGMSDEAKLFFGSPKYPELIYINESSFSTHFHIENNSVIDAENVQVLPGLSRELSNDKINKLFINLSVPEVRALLTQMNILPKDNELDKVIEDYNTREYINTKFLETILSLILIQRDKYSLDKARIFAECFGVKLELDPLIIESNPYTLKKII